MPGKMTILVVEDNDLLRELLRRGLDQRYTVLEARDGQEALQILRSYSGRLDLLLADVGLPDLNGWELVRRSSEFRPALKSLMMSGDAGRLAPPGDDLPPLRFLTKPFQLSELHAVLSETLGR
jgi:DNA-binding response OmpR family regulator